MNNWRSRYTTPYSQLCTRDEIEEVEREERIARQEYDDACAQMAREKVVEWQSRGRFLSVHFRKEDKSIYVIQQSVPLADYAISDLRRPTEQERRVNPDLYALLDDGETRVGLTKERYMALRQKLQEV